MDQIHIPDPLSQEICKLKIRLEHLEKHCCIAIPRDIEEEQFQMLEAAQDQEQEQDPAHKQAPAEGEAGKTR
jgi:hypothetical protein